MIRDAYGGTREVGRDAREILSEQMRMVIWEIAGKRIEQAIKANTMIDNELVLVTTEGTEGKIEQLGRISLKDLALSISEKRDEIEVVTKDGKISTDLCHVINQVLIWILDEKHAESLRSAWRIRIQ